jgi:A/G-specific adenine glycosylase
MSDRRLPDSSSAASASDRITVGSRDAPGDGPAVAYQGFPVDRLLDWYDRHGRDLPWRRRWPEMAPAYHVWLSEMMLQQTVVATVIPYFLEFTRRWPDVGSLAAAPLDDVLAAWAGLGYYARARNLHKAARQLVEYSDGQFPKDSVALQRLPGIGPYTAGAIAALAYGRQTVVVDGNIERLFCRFFAIDTPLPAAKKQVAAAYQTLLPLPRPSDVPQAMMDFANAVCLPKSPLCTRCPLAESCRGLAYDMAESLPVKPAKLAKPMRRAIAFVAINNAGEVFLQTRPEQGLFGGMLGFPEQGLSRAKTDGPTGGGDGVIPPFAAAWQIVPDPVTHVFTHFVVEMQVQVARLDGRPMPVTPIDGGWHMPRPTALPSLMRKIWTAAQPRLAGGDR